MVLEFNPAPDVPLEWVPYAPCCVVRFCDHYCISLFSLVQHCTCKAWSRACHAGGRARHTIHTMHSSGHCQRSRQLLCNAQGEANVCMKMPAIVLFTKQTMPMSAMAVCACTWLFVSEVSDWMHMCSVVQWSVFYDGSWMCQQFRHFVMTCHTLWHVLVCFKVWLWKGKGSVFPHSASRNLIQWT